MTGSPADMARAANLQARRRARFEAARSPEASFVGAYDMIRAALRRQPAATALAARRMADLADDIDRGELL